MQKTLETLCADLICAKELEATANERRIAIEQEIIECIGGLPEEGSFTTDARGYKVRVEQRISRKVDAKNWAIMSKQIPEALHPVKEETVLKVDTKGLHWLREKEPGYYALACQVIEEKPMKPSVKVEAVE